MTHSRILALASAILTLVLLAGCATTPPAAPYREPIYSLSPAPRMVLDQVKIDPALERRILAIDPLHVSDADVREVLAKGPVPRIVNIHGGIFPVHLMMESFARFLIAMGFPEEKVHNPGSLEWSHSPYEDSASIAGTIAWYYEHEGMRPLLIGHSQGGMQAVKVLYELSGAFGPTPVWNPLKGGTEGRTTIVDPLDGRERAVNSLVLGYASAVSAGGMTTLLPNQWVMAQRLYEIPNSVEEFSGYYLGFDIIALDLPGMASERYRALGTASIRNFRLPAGYSHVLVPDTEHLARSPVLRDWINAWVPADALDPPPLPPQEDANNILWAADVWYSIKKHWALEAQRLLRTKRVTTPG